MREYKPLVEEYIYDYMAKLWYKGGLINENDDQLREVTNNTIEELIKGVHRELYRIEIENGKLPIRAVNGNIELISFNNDIKWSHLMYKLLYDKLQNQQLSYKELLLNTTMVMAYNNIYKEIPVDIGKYLLVKDYGKYVYEILDSGKDFYSFEGNSVELLRYYFKHQITIDLKRNVLIEKVNNDPKDYKTSFKMVEEKFKVATEKELLLWRQEIFDASYRKKIENTCANYDISSKDLWFRLYKGMKLQEAIEIGILERDRYNLRYVADKVRYLKAENNIQWKIKTNLLDFVQTMMRFQMQEDLEYQAILNKEKQ